MTWEQLLCFHLQQIYRHSQLNFQSIYLVSGSLSFYIIIIVCCVSFVCWSSTRFDFKLDVCLSVCVWYVYRVLCAYIVHHFIDWLIDLTARIHIRRVCRCCCRCTASLTYYTRLRFEWNRHNFDLPLKKDFGSMFFLAPMYYMTWTVYDNDDAENDECKEKKRERERETPLSNLQWNVRKVFEFTGHTNTRFCAVVKHLIEQTFVLLLIFWNKKAKKGFSTQSGMWKVVGGHR